MAVRFRIRTSQGQELSFASHEMFEDFVRSGDLAESDLVYDAETGEWAPARTHPLVLEIEYGREEEEEQQEKVAEPAASGTEEGGEPSTDVDTGAMGLELAPEQLDPVQDAEEEKPSFVEALESGQYLDPDHGGEQGRARDIQMESGSVFAEMVTADPARLEEAPPPPPEPDRPKIARPSRRPPRKGGKKKAIVGVVVVGVLAVAAYAGFDLLGATDGGTPPDSATTATEPPVLVPDPEPTPPTPEPTIASTEQAVRQRARERFLTETQNALERLEQVPAGWLTGDYFRLPSDFPEVPTVWQEYRATVRLVRSGDEERYRAAFATALDAAAIVDDEARTQRTEDAMADMVDDFAAIDGHWDRVERLAVVALQSHQALVEAEGLILYDPTGGTGRPSGVGEGTSGRDTDAQLLLDQVVELLEDALVADGAGPREGANVREWVWGGFLDAVSR